MPTFVCLHFKRFLELFPGNKALFKKKSGKAGIGRPVLSRRVIIARQLR